MQRNLESHGIKMYTILSKQTRLNQSHGSSVLCRLVARTLHKSGFAQVFAIPKASVPIGVDHSKFARNASDCFLLVKFRDPATGLDCDLNVNDQLGLWNTQLISQYCNLVPDLVRPMIMAVKRWAKSHGMNDPSGQLGPITFSSYALVLMIIGFLQASISVIYFSCALNMLS